VIPDETLTERRAGRIKYVSPTIRDQPGSPLYRLDARLNIRETGGDEITLQVEMQNDLQKLSLVFRS
jgi:hypothetical protein